MQHQIIDNNNSIFIYISFFGGKNKDKESTEQDQSNQESSSQILDKLLQLKDETAAIKIKEHFAKQENELQNNIKQKQEIEQKFNTLDKNYNDLQKKVNELRKNLQQQIEDNELSFQRLSKEKEQAKLYAIVNFAKELIDVADNLERALENSKHLQDQNDNLFEGVKLTKNSLEQIFNRNKIIKDNPINEKFDPNLHEALFQFEDPTKTPGTISTVATVGYKIHDRILRAAKVGVVKKQEEK